MIGQPDLLRSIGTMFEADPRSMGFVVLDGRGLHPKTLEDQYGAVAGITLHEGVPSQIIVKFETAKNLNLFSWFVYRFHSAARSHVYECLELALRTRFKDEMFILEEERRRARHEERLSKNQKGAAPFKPGDKNRFLPTMDPLLRHAIQVGALKNENFAAWRLKTEIRARERRAIDMINKMTALGLTEMQTDPAVEITDIDRDHDYLSVIVGAVPDLRNHYAHGTSALDNHSLSALRLAAEIINQIFPDPEQP